MLKTYDSLDAVPEALREHYELSGGKYIPKVSDDHPLVVNSTKLLNEKNAAETATRDVQIKLDAANADLASARAGSLPRGQRAVSAADAELLEKIKAHGTADEVTKKLTEHKDLSEKVAKTERDTQLRLVAKELGYDNVEAFVLLPDLPEFEIREIAGKKSVIAKVKDGANIVEKPAAEFIESSPLNAPFVPVLKTKGGVHVPEQRRDNGASGDLYSRLRNETKAEQADPAGINTITERFGFGKVAAQA